MSQESLKLDLVDHPELTPMIDVDRDGNIVCFGWVSPVKDFNLEETNEPLRAT